MLSYADPDYVKFLDALQNPAYEEIVSIETYLEQLEAKEREAKGMLKYGVVGCEILGAEYQLSYLKNV